MIYIWNFVPVNGSPASQVCKIESWFLEGGSDLKSKLVQLYSKKNVKWLTSSPPSAPSISSGGGR